MDWSAHIPVAAVIAAALAAGGLAVQVRGLIVDVRELTKELRGLALWSVEAGQRIGAAEKAVNEITHEVRAPRRKATS